MTFSLRIATLLCGAASLGPMALAADFIVGPDLKKLEAQTRQRAEQATANPAAKAPGVLVPEDDVDILAPRGSQPRPERARDLPPSSAIGTLVRPEASRAESNRNLRDRASAFQREDASTPGAGSDEPSLLGPRGPASPASPREDRASDNRSRARAYQQAGEGGAADAAADRLSAMRERQRVDTSSGSADELDLSNVGRDGIPVVPCYRSGNTAGRIGDDSLSGMVVQVTRGGRLVKVRCK